MASDPAHEPSAVVSTWSQLQPVARIEVLTPEPPPPLPQQVSSNPSPRYVGVVARAFKQGAYGGTTYGAHYGDLGATFAAILLDREARSLTLDMDPIHGQLREPLLKV
jgi:hypothetical protein